MSGTSSNSKDEIEKAIALAKQIGVSAASEKLNLNRKTLQEWARYGPPKNYVQTQSDLLRELSDYILTYGPEIPAAKYERLTKTPGAYRRYWPSWSAFRNEAASICPFAPEYNKRIFLEVKDAVIVIGSDAHYHPYWGNSTAHRALLFLKNIIKPTHYIFNGDAADFPQITHHRPIAFKTVPTLKDELDELTTRIKEIEDTYPGIERYWNYGNHCIRFDNRLAEKVPEYKDVNGSRLKHHFPKWKFQNTIRFNELELEVKHRYRGGELATRHNVMRSGMSICVGHDHNRQIYRWRDARGTRYGFDPGCMAELFNPAFEYQENHTYNHACGLAVATFINEKMMPPELVEIDEPGVFWFRGKRYEV